MKYQWQELSEVQAAETEDAVVAVCLAQVAAGIVFHDAGTHADVEGAVTRLPAGVAGSEAVFVPRMHWS